MLTKTQVLCKFFLTIVCPAATMNITNNLSARSTMGIIDPFFAPLRAAAAVAGDSNFQEHDQTKNLKSTQY